MDNSKFKIPRILLPAVHLANHIKHFATTISRQTTPYSIIQSFTLT